MGWFARLRGRRELRRDARGVRPARMSAMQRFAARRGAPRTTAPKPVRPSMRERIATRREAPGPAASGPPLFRDRRERGLAVAAAVALVAAVAVFAVLIGQGRANGGRRAAYPSPSPPPSPTLSPPPSPTLSPAGSAAPGSPIP